MKHNIKSGLVSLFAGLLCCISCTPTQEMQLHWKIASDDNGYVNTFTVVNNGNKPLDKDWIIYFCRLPFDFRQEENAPLAVEQICGTYYKLYPTDSYRPIAEKDSLTISLVSSYDLNKCSFYPEGAFVVMKDKSGKDRAPVDLKIVIDDSDSRTKSNNIGAFEQNLKLKKDITLDVTDIFPSVKSVQTTGGFCSLKDGIQIIENELLTNEIRFLSNSLSAIGKHQLNPNGKTKIRLDICDTCKYVNNEHYFLEIRDSVINIKGQNPHAVFNGIQTLLTLSESADSDLPNLSVSDYPDLEYRGLMIDVARNFTSKENLLKIIDLMAAYKLNVLHLHLVDDEGWRIEIPGIEELTTIASKRGYTQDELTCLYPAYGSGWDANGLTGSGAGSGYYSRKDFIDILKYAGERHISVIPEIDFPGHSRAAITAMNARYKKYIDNDKEKAEEYLLSDFEDKSKYRSAQSYTDNVINAALPSAYRFVEKVIDELSLMYTDAGLNMTILHIGGDEVPHAWENSPVSRKFMQDKGMTSTRELLDYFFQNLLNYLEVKSIQPAGWQEIALDASGNPNPLFAGKNVQVNSWYTTSETGNEIAYKLAEANYSVVFSNVTNLYLDMSYNSSFNEPGHFWSSGVDEFMTFDMLPFYSPKGNIGEEIKKNIRGMQGQVWAETIRCFDMIAYSLLPKMYGLVERAWNASPDWASNPEIRDEALSKYNAVICLHEMPRLTEKGFNFRIAQPGLKVVDGKLHANSNIPGAEIRYTTNGSEPNKDSELWKEPVDCEAKLIYAKAFYLGKESKTTVLKVD